ncbi:MAG TPA: hypothetical protein VG712_07155 [Gemmatimonadales bacterium]|nr:hypothetical protein [Gemmatimonadales bacterium]
MTRSLLLTVACLVAAACADNSNDEAVGNLEVRVTTTGTPDPDGYTLSVTGQPDRNVAATDTTWYLGLPIDDYSVTLGDVEGGCVVQDGATKPKYVAIGSNSLVFSVDCP